MQALKSLVGLSSENFEYSAPEGFTVHLSNHSEVELFTGGRTTPVPYERRHEYANLAIAVRLNESAAQVAAIRKGFGSIVPLEQLSLFSW